MVSETQLLDDFEIRSLVVRERYYKDTFQWNNWRSTYHPEGEKTWVDIAWISGTIDKFVSESKRMVDRVSSTHSIQPVNIEINGDKALAFSYGHITLRFSENDKEYDMVSWGWWIHRTVKLQGASGRNWTLVAMRFMYDRDSITPTCPTPGPTLEIHPDDGARKSYKYLDWVLTRRGYSISRELAGTDDPSSIEKLRAQEHQWLKGDE